MKKTASAAIIYTMARLLQDSPQPAEPSRQPESDQPNSDKLPSLTNMQIAPNHKEALLIWELPYKGVPANAVGRVIVGERDTYYIVTLKLRGEASLNSAINSDLQALLISFRLL